MAEPRLITIHHSPDADDAFMFFGMVCGAVKRPGYDFRLERADIQTLNERALRGEVDVSAVSVHACFHLGASYTILPYGASFGGERHGPRLVARTALDFARGEIRTIALPGRHTSAALAMQIFLREKKIEAELVQLHFDKVQDAVKNGEVDAGLIIHEGQITAAREGLHTLLDLGAWWWQRSGGYRLPLGVNAARADLGEDALAAVSAVLRDSIEYALAHREGALRYAMSFGRGISPAETDQFVAMYVDEFARGMGEEGRRAIEAFRRAALAVGLIPEVCGNMR
jgi:1,4-dihydroxy-6-naphthoate synthase